MGPIGMGVDLVGNAVGLDPAVIHAAKAVVGFCAGDYVTATEGALQFGGDVIGALSQKTEYVPPKGQSSCKGYSQGIDVNVRTDVRVQGSSCGTAQQMTEDPKLRQESEMLGKLGGYFETYNDTFKVLGIFKDDVISKEDLVRVLNDPKLPEDVKATARYFLERPDRMAMIDGKGGSQLGDGKWNVADIYARKGEVDRQLEQSRHPVSTPPSPRPPPRPPPPAPPRETPPPCNRNPPPSVGGGFPVNPDSPLARDMPDYLTALKQLKANYDTFDTAVGRRDTHFTRENLQAILNNPNAAPELKNAAQFLIDHPEYFNRLEMAAGINGKDGVVGPKDVDAEIKRVTSDLNQYGVAPRGSSSQTGGTSSTQTDSTSGTTSSSQTKNGNGVSVNVDVRVNTGGQSQSANPSGGRSVGDIVRDPNLSLEQKVQLILMRIAEDADKEALNAMEEMGNASQELAEMKAGTKGDDKEGQKALQQKQQNVELLQQRMQQAVERRKQMYDLMSNMSSKFNDMSRTAIQNLAKA